MIREITLLCVGISLGGGSITARAQESRPARAAGDAIDLPFIATRIAVSADGARAAVWDTARNQTDSQSLAVVDLKRRKLAAQTILHSPLLDVVVGEDIYLLDEKATSRLSADHLKPLATHEYAGGARQFSNSQQPPQLMLVANHRLSAGPRMRLALPGLSLIENYDHDINTAEGWLDGRSGFGWFSEGVLWDHLMAKPLLLAWPYEFQRVPSSYSSREPGEFQPRSGMWHPFPAKLSSPPDRKVLASVTSPDIAATLGVVEGADGYHLASFRLDNGKLIASVPIASNDAGPANAAGIPKTDGELNPRRSTRGAGAYAIATGSDHFAVLLERRLYIGPLRALQGDESSLPFHIVPRQGIFVLASDKPVTFHYDSVGATRFRISSRILGSDGKSFEATSDTGEFTLSVSASLDGVLSHAAGLAANLNQGRDISDNHLRAEFYAGPSQSAFRRLFGREANGIPLPIDIQVTAEGSDFETAVLRHDFLVEVSLQQFEDALDRMYPHARSPWKKPTEDFDLTNYPAFAAPPSGREAWFDYLRGVWATRATPHPEVTAKELPGAARQAKEAGDKRLHDRYVKWMANKQWRMCTDVDGRQAEALLIQVFAGQVTLRTRKGVEFTFEETKLGDADREFLQRNPELVTPNDSESCREFVFAECAQTVNQFHAARNAFPPRTLTDDAGRPRLSWRVLLLRELGYGELFNLFHFDEPWNSEHNLALIPFMPNVLAIDAVATAISKTTILTVSSPLSAMPTSGISNMRSFGGEAPATVIFVEAVAARAAEWTKPVDLQLYEFTDPLSVVRARHNKIMVGLLSGQSTQLPDDTSSDDWRFAVNRGDGRRNFDAVAP